MLDNRHVRIIVQRNYRNDCHRNINTGIKTIYKLLALTRKICGILSKKLQKLALLKLLSNLSVKTTVFFYFFDIPQISQV